MHVDQTKNTLWLFPGDGNIPHAALFQSMFAENCIMIDPEYNEEIFINIMARNGLSHVIEGLRHRLTCIKDTVESFLEHYTPPSNIVLVITVAIHAHNNAAATWNLIERYNLPQVYVDVPCCAGFMHFPPVAPAYDSRKQDRNDFRLGSTGILNPCNRVLIYANDKLPAGFATEIVTRRY